MNFKPTLWKTIVSIIIFVLMDLFLVSLTNCVTSPDIGEKACPSSFTYAYTPINPFYNSNIFTGLVSGLIIYLVWSLIQRNKK